jgi:hypothetical protein
MYVWVHVVYVQLLHIGIYLLQTNIVKMKKKEKRRNY